MANKTGSRYRKVYTKVWGDDKFKALSAPPPCGRWLWIYLLTGPHTGIIPGLYSLTEAEISEKLHWPISATRRALDEICALDMAKFDREHGVLFIPKGIDYDPPANPNVVRGWKVCWVEVPECDLKREAYAVLKAHVAERGENFERVFEDAIEWPEPPNRLLNGFRNHSENHSPNRSANHSANQEQEQEQEQKEQNHTSISGETVSQTVTETVAETVRQVFAHWQTVMDSPRSMLDAKRTRLIVAALKLGYTATDLKLAIDGCRASPFHMGVNEKSTKFNGLDLILRNAEKIDQFIAFAASPPKIANGNGAHEADWFRSDQGIVRKARELGIEARAGESYAMLRDRIQAKLDTRRGAP
ncbi:hypothetical protein ACGYQ5_14370 [Burkholderia pseudomallei]